MVKLPDRSERVGNSKIAKYLSKQIEALKGSKTQRDIAIEIGYTKANMISMFKTGEAKVPLDKIPGLAAALHVDPAHLLKLAFEQYWPERGADITKIFGRIASANEEEIFLRKWRVATHDLDPPPSPKIAELMDRLIKEMKATKLI
jgi:transcriptional regulator with XRE-family HTH domain